MKDELLVALDFDGVICDSAPENAATAWRVGFQLWPELFGHRDILPEDVEEFCRIRPYMETGYQSILMTWLRLNGRDPHCYTTGFAAGLTQFLEECGYTKGELVAAFGAQRDNWIATDPEGWFGYNRLYDHAVATLRALMDGARVVILTTKEGRFVEQLLRRGGVDFPVEDIYGLERIRAKEDTLAQLAANFPRASFVEDRLATLQRMQGNPELQKVRLYFAQWGYTTQEQCAAALQDPTIVSLAQVQQLATLMD